MEGIPLECLRLSRSGEMGQNHSMTFNTII